MGFNLDALIDTAVTEAELASGVSPSVLMSRAERNGCSERKVATLATSVGAVRSQKAAIWTPEEEAYLEDALGYLSIQEIAQRLGRTPAAIKIRWTRLGLDAPSKQPGEVVATKVGRRMGVCGKLIIRMIDEGRMPGRVVPGGRNIHVTKEADLRRWVTRPENWIYFKVERIRDVSLKRLVLLAQERWPDEWWTPGQMAEYHNLNDTSVINNAIRRGDLPAVRWQNWKILKSNAVAYQFRQGSGRNVIIDWSVPGDAFIVLARAVGLTSSFIDELRGGTARRADWRLKNLMKHGQVLVLIKRFGLAAHYDAERGFLWADWRDHADRFPGLVRAVERFHAGARLSVRDRSVIRGVLWSWAQWHAATDEQKAVARKLMYMRWTTPENLQLMYEDLLGWGIDPLGRKEL